VKHGTLFFEPVLQMLSWLIIIPFAQNSILEKQILDVPIYILDVPSFLDVPKFS